MVWAAVTTFRAGNKYLWSHLGLEPGLQFFAVLGSDILIMFSDSSHDCCQILLRSCVHFNIHLSSHLSPQSQQVLQKNGGYISMSVSVLFVFFFFWFRWSHLLVVLLQVDQLILQTLHLHLQVGPAQSQLIQDSLQPSDVGLHRMMHGQLTLIPKKITKNC